MLHAGVIAVSGGYIGVDVFFVISGFLITSLLIDEVRNTRRVSILGFYARRARRILPAACFVIVVTVVVANMQLGALIGRATAIDGQWAAGFAANFRLIRQGTSYFGSALPPSPLQHFWSLAVEEQFYLVWPTVLFGFVMLGRRFTRSALVLQAGLVTIVAVSLYWSIHLSKVNPTSAYFSPFTRAWELAAGALVAVFSLTIARAPAPLRAAATWIGLSLIGIAAFTFTATTVFPGYAALLPVVGTALILGGGIGQSRAAVGIALGVAPIRWLGKISFSVYLWHWPVLVIAEERSSTPLSNVARVVCVLITLVLSVASYYAIERPLRSGKLLRATNPRSEWDRARKALAIGAVAIAVAVAVSIYTNNRAAYAIKQASEPTTTGKTLPSTLKPSAKQTTSEQITTMQQQVGALVREGLTLTGVPADVNPPPLKLALDPAYSRCLQPRSATRVKPCTFGAKAGPRTLVVFGDSHSMQWMPALDVLGRQASVRVIAVYKEACPVPSVDVFTGQAAGEAAGLVKVGAYPECSRWRTRALGYIASVKPFAVVLGFGQELTSEHGFSISTWISGLRASTRAIQATGAKVIEIGNNPYLREDPGLCLTRPNAKPAACEGTFANRDRTDAELAAVRADGGTAIDIEPWFCADGHCPVIIDHRIAYANYGHLSPQYVSDLEPLLAAEFKLAGVA